MTGRPTAAGQRPRRPLLAAGAALVLPGGAHLYARRPWTSLVLLVAGVAAIIGLVSGWRGAATGAALTLVLLVLGDLVLGQRAVRAANRGVHSGRGPQLATGLCVSAVAVGLGLLLGLRAPAPSATSTPDHPSEGPRGAHALQGGPLARGAVDGAPLSPEDAARVLRARHLRDGGAPQLMLHAPPRNRFDLDARRRRKVADGGAPMARPAIFAPAAPLPPP